MRAVAWHCIKVSDIYIHDEAPARQPLHSLVDGCPTYFLPLHLRIVGTRRVMTSILQIASDVGHTSASRDAVSHTPPR